MSPPTKFLSDAPVFLMDPVQEIVLEAGGEVPALWRKDHGVYWLLTLAGSAYYSKSGRPVFLSPGTAMTGEGPLLGRIKPGSAGKEWRGLYMVAANEMTRARLTYVARNLGSLTRMPMTSECVKLARRLAAKRLKADRWKHSLEAFRWFHAWWQEAERHSAEIRRLLGTKSTPRECSQEIFSLKSLAGQFGYSPSYLSRLLGRRWKESPASSLRKARLAFAARELRETDIQIGALAGELGYLSDSSFIRAFRQVYGLAPEKYRDKQRGRASTKRRTKSGSVSGKSRAQK